MNNNNDYIDRMISAAMSDAFNQAEGEGAATPPPATDSADVGMSLAEFAQTEQARQNTASWERGAKKKGAVPVAEEAQGLEGRVRAARRDCFAKWRETCKGLPQISTTRARRNTSEGVVTLTSTPLKSSKPP